MLKMTWFKHNIVTTRDVVEFIKTFKKEKPNYASFDTESNGLHIIRCKPFLLAFGFINTKTKQGHTYTVPINSYCFKACMKAIKSLFKQVERVVTWNAKFDMHMMHNIGYPSIFEENITDAMIYVRLAHDALSKSQGGVPDSLKDYAKQYITSNAKDHEKRIKSLITQRLKERTKALKDLLREIDPNSNWTMAKVYDILKDQVVGMYAFKPNIKNRVIEWLNNSEDPNDYSKLPLEIIEPYAHLDIIYTLEAFLQARETALLRKQRTTIRLEEQLILPLYRMERVGFAFDSDYVKESQQKLKKYIIEQRAYLCKLAGKKVTVGQHELLKQVFKEKYNLDLHSTAQDTLSHLNVKNDAQEFIDTILELRTLEKWYSTYIMRFLEDVYQDRLYTTIKQTGAASGRVSSGFQQFPNKSIKDNKGNILFEPRRMVKVSGNGYSRLLYIDYSQIELRIQAIYTIKTEYPDVNLCRAYMPYNCYRETLVMQQDGTKIPMITLFNHESPSHLESWDSDNWYLMENVEKKWEPIDLHSLTTKAAFPNLTEDSPDFPYYRKIGKQTNFACNYGASVGALQQQLNFNYDDAQKLYRAYVKSFPGVIKYRNAVAVEYDRQGYVENLFGRRYYGASPHHLANYLIQGSAADFLKHKIIEIDHLLKDYKTVFQMNIHDELAFELHDDDPPELITKLKEIMEEFPDPIIPIVADIEISNTTWADKKPYE